MRTVLPLLVACMIPLGARADAIRLADGQVVTGKIQSCERGEIVVAPPAAAPVLLKVADVASGEGADIERCLGGERRWYGGQVILAELGSMLLVPAGLVAHSGGLVGVGLVGMALSPAIVH